MISNFFSWWVIVITLVNIFACYWLIKWTMKSRPDEVASGESMGHEWDGLQELNNPLPRWWLWLFYITIIFGLGYLVVFPGLGNFKGVIGWTSTGEYAEEVKQADANYGPIFAAFAAKPIAALAKDPDALKAGERLYSSYCSQCHGSDAGGTTHFPNLSDNDWLWGGAPDTIKATIMNGRTGVMPAMGPSLGEQGVEQVAAYVQSLSGRQVDAAAAEAGKEKFMTLCAVCHTAEGTGNKALGAPNLTDTIWLHGGTAAAIKQTITNGRNNVMPAHNEFLGNDKSHLLAAYIYSLSN